MSSRLVVDTNVLLRFFLDDHPTQSAAVRLWLERAFRQRDPELILVATVITEMINTLRQEVPAKTHGQILDVLDALLDMPFTIVDRAIVEAATVRYRQLRARDLEDCLIAAYATALAEGRLATYDRSLASLPGIVAVAP